MNNSSIKRLSIRAWIVIVIAAILVGFIAYFFAFMGKQSDLFRESISQNTSWVLYLLPAVGLTSITLLRLKFFRGTEGTGIPQTIAALQQEKESDKQSLLSPKILLGKIILTTLGLFSGASMGREGPTVQVGACILFFCRKLVLLPQHVVQRGLILAGGAAGIAAAFNAPLAGIVFSIEEIGRSFDKKNLGILLIVVVIACIFCIGLFGDYWFYGQIHLSKASNVEWALMPVVAVCMGLLGGSFSRFIVCVYPIVMKIMFRRPIVIPMGIGLSIGLIGWLSSGQTLGTGFLEAKNMLMYSEEMEWYYAPLRLLATALTLLSGIPGGLFDPSLSAGAGFGQWFTEVARNFEWAKDVDSKMIMMISMACFFAAVVQSPITAVVIMVEMTDSVHATLPMLAGALIAYTMSTRICTCSIYVALASTYFNDNCAGEPPREASID
jgi:H+/Cl- antiporter ClcA